MIKLPLPTIEQNIIATLAFFEIFDQPLNFEELQRFLLGRLPGLPADLHSALAKQIASGKIHEKNNYYFLAGLENNEKTVEMRLERQKIAQKLWRKIKRFLPFIQMIPFIKMVAVCNTLAFDNPTPYSDIDLFIVTAKNRLFIARTLTTILFSVLGVRRHGHKIAGRFCLSFYVSEDGLNLEPIQLAPNDIYLPYWILSLRPIYGQKTYNKFMESNAWIKDYFSGKRQTPGQILPAKILLRLFAKFQELIFKGRFGDMIEEKLYKLQQKRHARIAKTIDQSASVVISRTMLKFHLIDRRQEIAKKFAIHIQNKIDNF